VNSLEISSKSHERETFHKQRWDALSISDSEFISCRFNQIKAKSVSLGGGATQSRYIECVFEGCDFHFFALGNVLFERCTFSRCKFVNLFSVAGEFVDCEFTGSTLRRGSINGRVPEEYSGSFRRKLNRVERNDFSQSVLIDFDFRGGVDLAASLLPADARSLFVSDTCAAAKALAAQGECGGLQKLLEHYCSGGQRQQMIYPPFTDGESQVLASMAAA
jgi:uncharacterized protein YjbI with pentapeptide repeats